MLTINIQASPLSLNSIYPTNKQGRRFLSKEGGDFKRIVELSTLKAVKEQGFSFDPATQYIKAEVYFNSPKLFTKTDGRVSMAKPDTDNCLKPLLDAIHEALKINDAYCLDVSAEMNYGDKASIVVILSVNPISKKKPISF